MQNLQAPSRLANTDTDVMVVARARLTQAADALMATDAARLLAGDIAEAIQRDPLTAEQALQIFASLFARAIMAAAIEQLDDHGEYLQVDGRSYRRAEATPGQAMTLFGKVEYTRSRYRPTSGKGASLFPTEAVLGLTEGSMTPAAAGLALWLTANLTARESAETWARLTGSGPAVSSLTGLTAEASRRFEADGGKITDELMAEEEIHPEAVAVMGCLDGVMLRMHAEAVNGKEIPCRLAGGILRCGGAPGCRGQHAAECLPGPPSRDRQDQPEGAAEPAALSLAGAAARAEAGGHRRWCQGQLDIPRCARAGCDGA